PPPPPPPASETAPGIGGHLEGCRIGFDLGGSDRKVAALIDGRVVYSEEIPWNPYFEKNPSYHIDGVQDLLVRAASHLPRVDAIGGSAAGVYVNNEVRVASLFRTVPPELFEQKIRRMFPDLRERWGGVPFEVANDGEVTALAGSMFMKDHTVLGISMGTSQAGGYVTPEGGITPWLNELAFVPVDYRPGAPRDEWSGDAGCGVQYFSQQAVARLARAAGFGFPEAMPPPGQLAAVQDAMKKDDPRARAIYETIGAYLGYSLGHYADFYELRNVLILGRVTSGEGGRLIIDRARAVLQAEFPELAARLALRTPGEQEKRHGQAIAAASLPAIPKPA
ncbi:transcriptional regulator, partial [Termitidicoccus mucosus]